MSMLAGNEPSAVPARTPSHMPWLAGCCKGQYSFRVNS